MWIYLLRHGVAEDLRAGMDDGDRALTEEGWQKLRAASGSWRRLVRRPSVVVTSPLLRARETAEVFVETTGRPADLRVDACLEPIAPLSHATTMLEGLLLEGTESVALIGHEPQLGYLLGTLLTGQERLAVPLKKGMLVGLQTRGATSLLAGLRFCLSQKAAAKVT
ncbi:MAG: SixA phosphatase family protein [Planctomycetota bacterium]